MPEHTDPIRDLENFGTGGHTMTPLAPTDVRRLGDRRRARRRSAGVAAAALAVVAVVVPFAVNARSGDGPDGGPILTDPTPTPTPPDVITYPGSGVEITDPADVDKLDGTSAAFKAFIADQARRAAQSGSTCPDAAHAVTVQKYSSAGYAAGGFNSCGGYAALWVRQDGQWKEALGTQDEWRCGDLARFDVPRSFAGECYGPSALFGPTEDAGLRLGMSGEQVIAAGGTVVGPAGACQGVNPPGMQPEQDSTLGYLSALPGKGVVALFAQAGQVTPEGISIGSSRADVERAYPDGHLEPMKGAWIAPIGENAHYRFDLEHGSTVRMSLEAEGQQDCYE